MANPQKSKGDRYERAAVPVVCALLPEYIVDLPMRKLGAGRKEDTGDLHVLEDTAIQVKAYKNLITGLWSAASGAEQQAANGLLPQHVGMVWVPRARQDQVCWLWTSTRWPVTLDEETIFVTGLPARAVDYVRNDKGDVPREERIALVRRASTADMFVATGEAWAAAYRSVTPVPDRKRRTE